jgi:hypothetical protein
MDPRAEEFSQLVGAVFGRFFEQNGQPTPSEGQIAAFSGRLWSLLLERGLPRPLAKGQRGVPGEMPEEAIAPMVARALGEDSDPWLALAAKQIVKACVYPEFMGCRESWSEVDGAGVCRRQELGRVRQRLSGTHCVDCPHWVALPAERHAAYLARHWRDGSEPFERNRAVFLPEDFRKLRLWLHARART